MPIAPAHTPFVGALLLAWTAPADAQDLPPPHPAAALKIPAFCGYAHPDPDAVKRDPRTGAVRECNGELVFYVAVARPGDLHVRLERAKTGASPALVLRCTRHPDGTATQLVAEPTADALDVDVGTFVVPQPGTLRLSLATADGAPLHDVQALHLSGTVAAGARASTVERRNASSVHLWYDVPEAHRDDVEWFYCELTPRTDPLCTYYMATGFARGYFGMQVNSATERRVIFSVWDSGSEAIDRAKVAAEDRVELVAKGDGVVAEGFGHEGTGGHSHLVYPWRLGDTFRFLVHAEPDGTHTTYTGWFWFAERGEHGEWGLIATFRAPKDGGSLRGLYSFSENFHGANGDALRTCDFGNVQVRTQGGEWLPLRAATFTHDGHGDQHRLDRRGGVRDGRFFLQHGDFATPAMRRGTRLELREATGAVPPELPTGR